MAILKPSRLVSTVSRFRSSSEAWAIECSRKSILPNSFAGRLHHGLDVVVLVHVQGDQEFRTDLGVGEHGHSAAIALTLVVRSVGQMRETSLPSLGQDLLGNRPGQRMVVGHSQDQAFFPFEQTHREILLPVALTAVSKRALVDSALAGRRRRRRSGQSLRGVKPRTPIRPQGWVMIPALSRRSKPILAAECRSRRHRAKRARQRQKPGTALNDRPGLFEDRSANSTPVDS